MARVATLTSSPFVQSCLFNAKLGRTPAVLKPWSLQFPTVSDLKAFAKIVETAKSGRASLAELVRLYFLVSRLPRPWTRGRHVDTTLAETLDMTCHPSFTTRHGGVHVSGVADGVSDSTRASSDTTALMALKQNYSVRRKARPPLPSSWTQAASRLRVHRRSPLRVTAAALSRAPNCLALPQTCQAPRSPSPQSPAQSREGP